ncbi:MAG: hypothetical protein AB7K52_10080 [Phycisphaerales bacterium]
MASGPVLIPPASVESSAVRAPAAGASRRWLRRGVPLGLSLAAHAVLIVLAGGVAWQIALPPSAREAEPTEAFIDVRTPLSRTAEPADRAVRPPMPVAPLPVSSSAGTAPERAEPARPAPPPIGRVEIEAAPPALPPVRTGPISATLDAGDPSPVSFAGLSAKRAVSVVFVIDASAPMVGVLPRVLAAVRESATALLSAQQFGVVVFHDEVAESFSPRLVDATPRNLGRLADWLARVEPRGPSTPLEGLRAALSMNPRPRVVFLLSRSIARSHGGQWGAGTRAILDELDALNPIDARSGQRPSVIKALQFLEPDPTGTMQALAERHGGGGTTPDYRVLLAEELPR